ncbi:MAG: hypothetical protein AUJ85_03005 [Elusimicrobia bacterium CG1_02_37_114]|nr:MAG: hypothetical protein AUJ85_03005 [Elusimicrobia bacterium CG1_02_37_114]PIV52707.1 MAG: hypothetical protein COS17_07790 [Elusimicrobia bacterium CG02_land_8_20_14_3_00_37_13]PIZ13041.1 MAG: hypothetical protein COY53_06990 [Elusimicrobia bacterium CG_4_10_14_0_8_um_filter_37_32]
MILIIHRGAGESGKGEIGGNCIELQSSKSRILLDYGAPLPKRNEKQDKNTLKGILNIPGLYTETTKELPLTDIIISHSHQDHYGVLLEKAVKPKIRVSRLLEDFIRISASNRYKTIPKEDKTDYFTRYVSFNAGINDEFQIYPYPMDHSAAEAFSFEIKVDGKTILYTGDFRNHGHKGDTLFKRFKERVGKADILLTEGTMMGRDDTRIKTEKELMSKIEKISANYSGHIFVLCSFQNIDLITSLIAIAKNTQRELLLGPYATLILDVMQTRMGWKSKIPSSKIPYLKILPLREEFKRLRIMFSKDKDYKEILDSFKPGSWDSTLSSKNKYIIPITSSYLRWIAPKIKSFKDSILVYSMWEGYLEDPKFYEIIEYFEEKGVAKTNLHVSGHAYIKTLKEVVDKTDPDIIIPIHTEYPEKFKELFGDKVHTVKNGEEIKS